MMIYLKLAMLMLTANACNLHDYASSPSNGQRDAQSIRRVFGVRNALEINATMYAATTPSTALSISMPDAPDAKVDRERNSPSNSQPDYTTPNSDTSCYKQNRKGKWKATSDSSYCQVHNLLPTDSQAQSFTGTTQTGIFKLASHYCGQLMKRDASGKAARLEKLPLSAKELNSLDFQQRSVQLGEELKKQLAKDLVNLNSLTATAEQQTILIELIDDLAQTKEANEQTPSLAQVLIGACSAALGSAQTVFY